ncbi:hypothetical protein BS78_01G424900 [Paspalum vaginatum]|nr:hypothetical protein BS78_01G424900 [Paspalum vaginatum]
MILKVAEPGSTGVFPGVSLQNFTSHQRRLALSDRCAGAPAMASTSPSLNRREPPTRALGLAVAEEKEKAQSSFQKADDSRCKIGTEQLKLEPADRAAARATRVRLCSSCI